MNTQELVRRLELAGKGKGKESGDPGPFLRAMKKASKGISEKAKEEAVHLGYEVGAIDVLSSSLKGGLKGAVKQRGFDELTDIFEVYATRNGYLFKESDDAAYFEHMESGYNTALNNRALIISKFGKFVDSI